MIPSVSSVPSASATSLSTGTPSNVTQLVLSPGAWLAWAFLNAALTGATLTALVASLSWTSGALSGQSGSNVSGNRLYPEAIAQAVRNLVTATGTETIAVGPTVVTVPPNANPTLFLVGQASFSAGTVAAYGSLFAYQLPS